jgi:hypothetical protein
MKIVLFFDCIERRWIFPFIPIIRITRVEKQWGKKIIQIEENFLKILLKEENTKYHNYASFLKNKYINNHNKLIPPTLPPVIHFNI